MLVRIIEHGGADASLEVGAGEHVVVDASLATAPECRVVGELFESDGPIAQFVIDLEYGSARRQSEEFGFGVEAAAVIEREALDTLGKADATVLGADDESGIDDVLLVAPAFDIAKPANSFSQRAMMALPSIIFWAT